MARSRNRALVLEIVADPKKAQKGLNGIEGSVKKFGGQMLKMGAAYFGTRALLDFGKASINAASDLEESTNAVERAMGGAAASVKALGTDSASALGLSKTGLNELAVSFAAFGDKIAPGASGDAFGAIIQRATDFASVMNIDVEEAMGTFQSALAGQSQPIRAYGLDLSAAAVQAHALAVGIWDGNQKITESEKIQARYGLILQETEQYAGDFAATADGLANSTRILSAEWTDLQAELGKQALPLAADGVNVLVGAVQNAEHYTLRLAGALAETRAYAQSFVGEFGQGATFGMWGGDMEASGDWNHMLAQIINSQKLYHRILGDGGEQMHAYASAQLRLIKSGEGNTESHGRLQAAIGATDEQYLHALESLRSLAVENGLAGDSLDDLNYAIQTQEAYLKAGRDELDLAGKAWDEYGIHALEGLAPVEEMPTKLEELEAAFRELNGEMAKTNDPFGIWDTSKWSVMWGDLQTTIDYWDLVTESIQNSSAAGRAAANPNTGGGYDTAPQSMRPGQAPIEINIQAGIMTDPAEIGREVRGVLNAYASVGG